PCHGHLRALHSFPTRRSSDLRLPLVGYISDELHRGICRIWAEFKRHSALPVRCLCIGGRVNDEVFEKHHVWLVDGDRQVLYRILATTKLQVEVPLVSGTNSFGILHPNFRVANFSAFSTRHLG